MVEVERKRKGQSLVASKNNKQKNISRNKLADGAVFYN